MENRGQTGTEHYTCMIDDRLSMYTTTLHKYTSEQVQCKGWQSDSQNKGWQPMRFANTILSQLPRTCFAVLVNKICVSTVKHLRVVWQYLIWSLTTRWNTRLLIIDILFLIYAMYFNEIQVLRFFERKCKCLNFLLKDPLEKCFACCLFY